MVVRPLVFVAMPFGTKPDSMRISSIDFDEILGQLRENQPA
jgi:hypothetical protein